MTFNHRDPYPGMKVVRYGTSQAYVFENPSSDKLIISIEGSGWNSSLGSKNEREWEFTHYGAQFLQVLGGEYTFFIPEKLERQPGQVYFDDMRDRANYTSENLLYYYSKSINGYLSSHSFSSVILIGTSEGAALLPLVYERIDKKDLVKALVSVSFGGLSLYDSFAILSSRPELQPDYRAMYQYFVDIFKPGQAEYPNSFAEDLFDVTYRWFNSFKDIRPFDYYKNIDIPILFIHGENDYNIPVESTKYIEENLPGKPFEYWYYKWGHQTESYFDILGFRNDVAVWVRNIDAGLL
jgi:pimeloyl-ACP methyl ester carboxylesterase